MQKDNVPPDMKRKSDLFQTLRAYATWRRLAAAVTVTGGLVLSGAAGAGDFYLRAGVGFDRPDETTFTDRDCPSTSPAVLYGCGRGGDGAPYRSLGDFGTPVTLEGGLGYAVAVVRLEALAEYRPHVSFEGRANFLEPGRRQSVVADLSTLSGMLAAYVDLPALASFVPFIGAGAGAVSTRIGETRMTFPRTTTIVPGARRTDFAWMATAGVSAALGERTTLELAWRYTDLGAVHTDRGEGRVIWRDGRRCCSISTGRGRSSGATASGCRCATRSETKARTDGHRPGAVPDGLRPRPGLPRCVTMGDLEKMRNI